MDCDPLIPRQTAYRSEFNHFLKISVEAVDLQVLLDCKPGVIESMIIGHIERLRDVEKLPIGLYRCIVQLSFISLK